MTRREEIEKVAMEYASPMTEEDEMLKYDAFKSGAKWADTYPRHNTDADFERELSKYVSDGIHRFFPNVDDDYCKMDSVIWQDYIIETARHFYELGLNAQK